MGKRVQVIGGGAAGMMAAITAAQKGCRVTLYEKNDKLGKKLFITGKGRCNLTNACPVEDLFQNVVSNAKFLYSAIYSFDNDATQAFFEEAGCHLKTERGERVFPISDHSSDVIRALEKKLRHSGVEVCLGTKVVKILTDGSKRRTRGICLQNGEEREGDSVILTTGGCSYPVTGSDGGGFQMAAALGHSVTQCLPALVPFETKEEWCQKLQGLSLRNVRLSLILDDREVMTGLGEMLFTHYGVSGPLVLTASSYYAAGKRTKKGFRKAMIYLDLKPALDLQQLDRRLLRDFEENRNKCFRNALDRLLPLRLIPVVIKFSDIEPDKRVCEITKEERLRLASVIKRLPVTIKGTRDFSEAIITQGGLSLKEVNPSTLESKLVKGLYFAGEILDIDALTGGFNLQLAWSTGHLAGECV